MSRKTLTQDAINLEHSQAQVAQLVENYELIVQGPGTAMLPREVAAGLIAIMLSAHKVVCLLQHFCSEASMHVAFTPVTEHGAKHLMRLGDVFTELEEALETANAPAHRMMASCANEPGAANLESAFDHLRRAEPLGGVH